MSKDRDYWGDVVYEVWRRGGNSDLVDRDRTDDYRREGLRYEQAAAREMRSQRPQREEYPPEDCTMEQYPPEEYPPEEVPE